jgi:hypothetical protein
MEKVMTPQGATSQSTPSDASPYTIHELLTRGRPNEADIAAENARLAGDVSRMAERQREVMELLNCKSPERIVHDLRNLINELNLYRQLVEATEE